MGMSIKLLVDKESNKVVYGEAGKDFVDFLLGLMEIPLGSIIRLLKQSGKMGTLSLGKVYQSVESLDASYLQKSELRNSVLNPGTTPSSKVKQSSVLQQLVNSESIFGSYSSFGSSQSNGVDGYVKGAVTYMVMDDLTVTPSSTISSINLLNTKGIKEMGALQEMIVEVDKLKALELVRASFQSSTVLTDVFLSSRKKKRA